MRFLIFDAYGTLVELDDFYARLQRGFAGLGVLLPLEVVTKAARAEMRHYVSRTVFARSEADWIALKTECAGILAKAIRAQHENFELGEAQVLRVLEAALVFRVFPEVREVLDNFKARGVKMGVLSNWDFSLHHILDSAGLSEYFSFVLPSSEAGVQKPAREFFSLAWQRARREYSRLQRRQCWYVGDHYDGDVLGAREAGMKPIWLVRAERDLASGELREDKEVPRIADLRGLLSLKPFAPVVLQK
jgi:putative hydrolase of the HAD superfamily